MRRSEVDGVLGRTMSVRASEHVARGGEKDGTGSMWVGWGANSVKDARNDGGHGAKNVGNGGHISSTVLVRVVPGVEGRCRSCQRRCRAGGGSLISSIARASRP